MREMTMWAALETWDCSTCGCPMPFEALHCTDGHDGDCPDRICTGCGEVLMVAVPVTARGCA